MRLPPVDERMMALAAKAAFEAEEGLRKTRIEELAIGNRKARRAAAARKRRG